MSSAGLSSNGKNVTVLFGGALPLALGTTVGVTGYVLIYLMLVTSFDAPARGIGPKAWRRLQKTGFYLSGSSSLRRCCRSRASPSTRSNVRGSLR